MFLSNGQDLFSEWKPGGKRIHFKTDDLYAFLWKSLSGNIVCFLLIGLNTTVFPLRLILRIFFKQNLVISPILV